MIYSIFIVVFVRDGIDDNGQVIAIDKGLLMGWKGHFFLHPLSKVSFPCSTYVYAFGSLSWCIFIVVIVAARCLIRLY